MNSLWRKAAEFLNNRRKDKRWRKIVTSLAAVVVFVTTYALILPAITMDDETAEQEPGIVLVQDEAAEESEVVEESDDPGEFENEDEEDAIVIDAGDGDHAAETDAEVIVMCGVHFMGETAKILCPDKRVIVPDPAAGCSLADSCDPDEFKAFIEAHPGHTVISYVNTSARVKALTDIVVTSGNARKVVESLPADEKIIFGPDKNLGG